VDIASGKLIDEIPAYGAAPGDVSGLSRSSSGRLGYAKSRDGRAISVLDLSNFRPVRQLDVGRSATKVFPTCFGGYLVVPDNLERTVTVIANSSMSIAAMLKGRRRWPPSTAAGLTRLLWCQVAASASFSSTISIDWQMVARFRCGALRVLARSLRKGQSSTSLWRERIRSP